MQFDVLLVAFLAAFLGTFITAKIIIRKAPYTARLKPGSEKVFFATDNVKPRKPLVARFGGMSIVFGFAVALLVSLTLIRLEEAVPILAGLATVLMVAFIGLFVDLFRVREVWRVL